MYVGSLIQLSYLNASASMQLTRGACGCRSKDDPDASGAQATGKDGDAVQVSPHSGQAFSARVQVSLEQISIASVQQLLAPQARDTGSDPLAPLRRFQGILQQASQAAGLPAPTSADGVPDFLKKLQDYFSPQNTAQRIFESATKHYGKGSFSGKDTQDLRTKYRDYILPAIQKGFDQAKAELGKLSDSVSGQIGQTFNLIQSSLDNFVKNGLSQPQTNGSASTAPKDAAA